MHFGAKLVPQGGPGDLEKVNKSEKTALGTFLVSSCASGSILDGFWMDFGRIWEDFCDFWVIFGWILGVIFDDFWFVWGRRAQTQLNNHAQLNR